MLYVIHALDHENMVEKRDKIIDKHREYAKNSKLVSVAISGPLMAENGNDIIGSLLIVEATSREIAEEFATNDPINKAGIWRQLDVTAFYRRVG